MNLMCEALLRLGKWGQDPRGLGGWGSDPYPHKRGAWLLAQAMGVRPESEMEGFIYKLSLSYSRAQR